MHFGYNPHSFDKESDLVFDAFQNQSFCMVTLG